VTPRTIVGFAALLALAASPAPGQGFHGAPASAAATRNPFDHKPQAVAAGAELYTSNCGACHGRNGRGTGNIPPLARGPAQSATDGELFWFITRGDEDNGMPSWKQLPENDRWQIISYVKSLPTRRPSAPPKESSSSAEGQPARPAAAKSPEPNAPFTDYRFEAPGRTRKITVQDLPAPYATQSAHNGPDVVARPKDAWPKVPAGFKVDLYATGLDNPRTIRTAPNGDLFVAQSDAGLVRVFRGISSAGKPEQAQVFASGLHRPYGIAFYPPGPNPQWVYVGNEDSLVRFPYKTGDMKAGGAPQHLADLPDGSAVEGPAARFTGGVRVARVASEQAHLTFGFEGRADRADDYFAARLFADILGGGASSRLFHEVREARGLAYSVSANVHPLVDTGLFYVHAATSPREAAAAAQLIDEILRDSVGNVTERELERVRRRAAAGLLMHLETPWGQASYAARQLAVYDRLVEPAEVVQQLAAVTLEEVRAAGSNMLGGPRATATIGVPSVRAA